MTYKKIKKLKGRHDKRAFIIMPSVEHEVTIIYLTHDDLFERLTENNNFHSLSSHLIDCLNNEKYSLFFEFWHDKELYVFLLDDIYLKEKEFNKALRLLNEFEIKINEIYLY